MSENTTNSNITWDGTPIDEIHRDSLALRKINENGTLKDMIDTINSNFRELAVHGGGPSGFDGMDGVDGVDGVNAEFIYALCDSITADDEGVKYPSTISEYEDLFTRVNQNGDYAPYRNVKWYNHPNGISAEQKNEYVIARYRTNENSDWSYSKPALWSHWGEKGKDGDGVEYVFTRTNREITNEAERAAMLLKKENMTAAQKVLFNLEDFFPGEKWFIEKNREKARTAISNAGLNTSDFATRWNQCFGMVKNGVNWTDDPMGTDASHPYEYVAVRRCNTNPITGEKEWENFSLPALWSNYSTGGGTTRVFIVYCNVIGDTKPQAPEGGYWNVGGNPELTNSRDDLTEYKYNALTTGTPDYNSHVGYWEDNNEDVEDTISWMASGVFGTDGENISWSEPFRITGKDGAGYDSDDREFIYALCNVDSMEAGTHYPSSNLDEFFDAVEAAGKNGYTPSGISVKWYDRAQPISSTDRIEYCWSRWKNSANSDADWVYSDEPVIWAHWGEDGTDGDGVEYVFCGSTEQISWSMRNWMAVVEGTIPDNPTARAAYDMHDFIPNSTWFIAKKSVIQEKLGGDFNGEDWDEMKTLFSFDQKNLGVWQDNPPQLTAALPYIYVSIRTSPEGVWGPFSLPTLWTKYNYNKFTSFAFTATTPDDDLGGITPTGGSYSNPLPDNVTGRTGNKPDITWTDAPMPNAAAGKTEIWMTSALVEEGSQTAPTWSPLRRMVDTSDFNVEWSTTDKSLSELATINNTLKNTRYNFGEYLKTFSYDEDLAEQEWRDVMSTDFGIDFSDTSGNACLMATCQLKNGVWSPWKIERVKGEKGDAGTSITVTGKINHEVYFEDNTTYNATNANTVRLNATLENPVNTNDLLIVYPKDPNNYDIYWGDDSQGGGLYMWKYNGTSWESFTASSNGVSYVSLNGHLILWDGDSWQDLGLLSGPEGKTSRVLIKYATGDLSQPNTLAFTNDPIAAKYIGFLVYIEEDGVNPNDFLPTNSKWNWSPFKGQDGYGYEYIFKLTVDNQAPVLPSTSLDQDDYIPDGWTDDPGGVSPEYPYCWVAWRKKDPDTGWGSWLGTNGYARLYSHYGTDGATGEHGNGYQYRYARYKVNDSNYPGTRCFIPTSEKSKNNPSVFFGETIASTGSLVSTYSEPRGADSTYTYEYRLERSGYDGSWSNWSDPVTVAKYLDVGDISSTVRNEVSIATSNVQQNILNSLSGTISRVNELSGYFDASGNLTTGIASSIMSGYMRTDGLGNALDVYIAGVSSTPSTVTTFADWIDYENNAIATVGTSIDSINTTISTFATQTALSEATGAFQNFQADVSTHFAQIDQSVANATFVTDEDGYLLVEINGVKRQALDNNGNPTNNYLSVCDADRPYLITVVNELAAIIQSVGSGYACTEIMATVNGNTAAIFEYADESESAIMMNADLVGISSTNFNLDPNEGLTMKGNLYAKDEYNRITAGVIGNNTDGNQDVKFFAGTESVSTGVSLQNEIDLAPFRVYENGHVVISSLELGNPESNTYIDSDGILHARGAYIQQDIIADKFEATSLVDVSVSTVQGRYSGQITEATTIRGNEFSIAVADGCTLTKISGAQNAPSTIDVGGNAIYIRIVDAVKNENSSIVNASGTMVSFLYGVPTLCMMYNGVEYILSPANWQLNSGVTANNSNMKWKKMFDGLKYSINDTNLVSNTYMSGNRYTTSISSISGLSTYFGNSGNVYIFKPDYESNFINNYTDTYKDEVCRFYVQNLGDDEATAKSLINQYGLATSTTSKSTINNTGAVTLKKTISGSTNIPDDYIYRENSTSKVNITDSNCDTYSDYLRSSFNIGLCFTIEEETNVLSDVTGTDWNLSTIYTELFKRIMNETDGTDGIWSDSNSAIYKVDVGTNNMPFDTGGNYTSYIRDKYMNVYLDFYPISVVESNGTSYGTSNNNNKCDTMWVKCKFIVEGDYNNASSLSQGNMFSYKKYVGEMGHVYENTVYFNPIEIQLTVEFDLVFKNINMDLYPFTGGHDAKDETRDKLKEFFQRFTYSNIYNRNYIKFTGKIIPYSGPTLYRTRIY